MGIQTIFSTPTWFIFSGGISELEKQLKLEDNSHEVTTPAISKNLYNKVFSGPTNNR